MTLRKKEHQVPEKTEQTIMPIEGKILSLPALQKTLEDVRRRGRRIVLCHGVFDIMHPGHLLHFKAARKFGDILVVTVTPDHYVNKGPGRPVFNQRLRTEMIAAMECVDYVAINQWPTATPTILMMRPDIYAKGHEYEDHSADLTKQIVEETAAIEQVGGRAIFTEEETYSSSTIINKFFSAHPPTTDEYLKQFRKRHSADQVLSLLQGLATTRVLVVGESILDQYCYCQPVGKSPKETIVATRFISEEHFAGGSLAIANHLAGFCGQVTLVTTLGTEPHYFEFIQSKLRPNVQLCAVRTDGRPTITKRRYVEPSFMTKMFEVQYLEDIPPSSEVEANVSALIRTHLQAHDLVVVADYGHGLFTEPMRSFLCASEKFLSLNTQTNSANFGCNPATKYTRASYMCIDEPELMVTYRTKYGDIKHLATQLCRTLGAQHVLVTRGQNPSTIIAQDGSWYETPVLSKRVVDRTGAGDAVFAVTSPCAYKNASPEVMAFIGNCVGAMAVEIVCNRDPIDPVLLYKFITAILK